MNYLTKKTLDKYKEHWVSLRDAGFIKNLNQVTILELEAIYKQEVDDKFFVNKWCMSCVAEMIQRIYLSVNYDRYTEPIEAFAESIQSTTNVEATFTNDFKPEDVNKQVPKRRGRKSRK